MSVIKGPFDFTGSFGNLRVYDDPATGKRIIAEKGGPSADQFWNLPNYARARENVKEFGGQSKWASLVKQGLSDIGHLMYVRCFNQIMSAGYHIQKKDEKGKIGFRGIAVRNDPGALLGIDFNERRPFRFILRDTYETGLSPDKTTVTLKIPGFVSSRDARWMTKFYAVRFYLVIAQVADMVWNPDTNIYQPVVGDLEMLSRCTVSDWMVGNSVPVDVLLEAAFEEPALNGEGTAVVVALGVEFSTQVFLGQPYVEPKSGSMAIVGCYTE